MRQAKLDKMTAPELVERFAAICLDQDQALLYGDTARFTRFIRRW
jgi:hypothetical protein